MRTMIEGYQNHPGQHCGSVAMRGLLQHYCGLELPESAVFGLGSGAFCMYIDGPKMDPSPVLFGRSGSMEVDVASALGIDYREQAEPDDDLAWEKAREEVLAGRPTMLSGDILYLDYREFKVHFPAHRFVLLGFDDETERVFIADRINVEAEECSYGALRRSRNPPEGMSTFNMWGRFHSREAGRSLEEATRVAIDRCARAMLEGSTDGFAAMADSGNTRAVAGVDAIRELAAVLPGWADRQDAAWVASYNGRCIEKFGNGGGNFRRLYAGFLEWARALDQKLVPADGPAMATRCADGWTGLAETLMAASAEDADAKLFSEAAEQALVVADLEERLFTKLGEAISG